MLFRNGSNSFQYPLLSFASKSLACNRFSVYFVHLQYGVLFSHIVTVRNFVGSFEARMNSNSSATASMCDGAKRMAKALEYKQNRETKINASQILDSVESLTEDRQNPVQNLVSFLAIKNQAQSIRIKASNNTQEATGKGLRISKAVFNFLRSFQDQSFIVRIKFFQDVICTACNWHLWHKTKIRMCKIYLHDILWPLKMGELHPYFSPHVWIYNIHQ